MAVKDKARTHRKLEIEHRFGEGQIRAGVQDKDAGTIEMVLATGNRVLRVDYSVFDGPFWEELSMQEGAVRLARLQSGRLNLIDNHGYANGSNWGPERYQLQNILGVIVENSARFEGEEGARQLVAKARLSVGDRHADILKDVRAGVITQISVGYRVHRYEVQEIPADGYPVLLATDWEPTEASMTACPADADSHTRASGAQQDTSSGEGSPPKYSCVLVERAAQTQGAKPVKVKNGKRAKDSGELEQPKGQRAGEAKPQETRERNDEVDEDLDDEDLDDVDEDQDDEPAGGTRNAPSAAAIERQRVLGIQKLCKRAGVPETYGERLIDKGVPLDKARSKIFDKWEADQGERDVEPDVDDEGDEPTRSAPRKETARTREVRDVSNEDDAISLMLMNRGVPTLVPASKLTDHARKFVYMRMVDIAAHFLERRHERVRGMAPMRMIARAMTTTDFPNLLANTAEKTLRDQYQIQASTWQQFCNQGTLVDFKATPMTQMSDAPALEEIPESGAVTTGKLGDVKENRQLKSYGKMLAITRQAIINDDLSAFTRIPSQFAISAAVLIEDLVYSIFGNNAPLSDGVALFASAHGNNATGGGSALAVAGLSACRTALRNQQTVNGKFLNLPIKYLLVPTTLETTADQLNTQLLAAQTSNVNPFSGKFTPITNPRLNLHTNGTTTWYAIVEKEMCDTIQVDFLQGESGPTIESEVGFEVAGIKIKCNLDVGAKPIDFRGMFRNVGA